jgi:Helix-turn-helix domain
MKKNKATSFGKKAALKRITREFTGSSNKTQCARLLEALARYPITTFEAMRYLDVYHCPARVLDLRKLGHDITTHWQTVETESGESHRVGLYVLKSGNASVGVAA